MASFPLKRIDVCLSPALIDLYPLDRRTVVIIDILRATSCITTALAHGVAGIIPVADLDACRAMRADGYCTAGERNGEKVDGFDMGNSPFEYMNPDLAGRATSWLCAPDGKERSTSKTRFSPEHWCTNSPASPNPNAMRP